MSWLNDILGIDLQSVAAVIGRRRTLNFGRSLRVTDDAPNSRATIGLTRPCLGPVAWVQWHTSGSPSYSIIYDAHEEAWNAPGTGQFPVIARTYQGIYTVTYPTTYVDEMGATQSMALRFGVAHCTGAATGDTDMVAETTRTSANVFGVRLHEGGGTQSLDAPCVAFFW
jgi:hypothetical protein